MTDPHKQGGARSWSQCERTPYLSWWTPRPSVADKQPPTFGSVARRSAEFRVSRAPWRVSLADGPNVPEIEQTAAVAVHIHAYGDQRFRRVRGGIAARVNENPVRSLVAPVPRIAISARPENLESAATVSPLGKGLGERGGAARWLLALLALIEQRNCLVDPALAGLGRLRRVDVVDVIPL